MTNQMIWGMIVVTVGVLVLLAWGLVWWDRREEERWLKEQEELEKSRFDVE